MGGERTGARGRLRAATLRGFPAAQISRYRFATGEIDRLTQAEGGALRPVLSPDGRLMVYATRRETQTGFRIRDLVSGADRWLTWPVQRDAQENFRPPSRSSGTARPWVRRSNSWLPT